MSELKAALVVVAQRPGYKKDAEEVEMDGLTLRAMRVSTLAHREGSVFKESPGG